MTVSTETWYTGYHPYTLEPVFSAKTQAEKLAQRQYFFWYKKPQDSHQAHSPHSAYQAHANHRTDARRQEPKEEKRGRNRRHR
jgi:hypothetical protein